MQFRLEQNALDGKTAAQAKRSPFFRGHSTRNLVQRGNIQDALPALLETKIIYDITIDILAKSARMGRATSCRCYVSVEEVMVILYDDSKRPVWDRLMIKLPRTDEIEERIGDLFDQIFRETMEIGRSTAKIPQRSRPPSPSSDDA